MALFHLAEQYLSEVSEADALDDDQQRRILRLRMQANAYFTTYDYIYEPYVSV